MLSKKPNVDKNIKHTSYNNINYKNNLQINIKNKTDNEINIKPSKNLNDSHKIQRRNSKTTQAPITKFSLVSGNQTHHTKYKLHKRTLNSTGNDYCETEVFKASCDQGTAILMTSAMYGRMRISRCVKVDYGSALGCHKDVRDVFDLRSVFIFEQNIYDQVESK